MSGHDELEVGGTTVVMKGVGCTFTTPYFFPQEAPTNCLAVGWRSTEHSTPEFVISALLEGGFAMVGHLDPASYEQLVRLLISAGQQANETHRMDNGSPASAFPCSQDRLDQPRASDVIDDQDGETQATIFRLAISKPMKKSTRLDHPS